MLHGERATAFKSNSSSRSAATFPQTRVAFSLACGSMFWFARHVVASGSRSMLAQAMRCGLPRF